MTPLDARIIILLNNLNEELRHPLFIAGKLNVDFKEVRNALQDMQIQGWVHTKKDYGEIEYWFLNDITLFEAATRILADEQYRAEEAKHE